MTLNELKRQVMHLGFESQIENEEAFMSALTTSLGIIYSDRPQKRTLVATLQPATPLSRVEKISLSGGEEVTLPLLGGSYALEVSGKGQVSIFDGSSVTKRDLNTSYSVLRGTLFAKGTLTAKADITSQLSIFNLVVFREVTKEGIPVPRDVRRISLDSLSFDFAAALSLPRDAYGREVRGAHIEGSELHLPSDFSGTVTIPYRARAPKADEIASGEEIPLDRESEHLLPLLVASFLWLDDDEEKARYYMSLYRDLLSTVRRYGTHSTPVGYGITDGWA